MRGLETVSFDPAQGVGFRQVPPGRVAGCAFAGKLSRTQRECMRAGRPRSRVGRLLPSLLFLEQARASLPGHSPDPAAKPSRLVAPSWITLFLLFQADAVWGGRLTSRKEARELRSRSGRGWEQFGFRLSERAAGISCVSFAGRREPGPALPNRGRDSRKKSL